MPRQRKTVENSTGHLAVVTRLEKARQEEAVSDLNRELLESTPRELRDKVAKKAWKRILPDLMKLPVLCNLDRDALINYCNAWSEYIESVEAQKQIMAKPILDSKALERWWRRQEKAQDALRKFGALCGMSIDSRLKMAESHQKKEAEQLDKKFGVI